MKDIMNADKYSVDYNCGENNLVRESMDFDTAAKTDVLVEAMPKKQTKTTVDASFLAKANDTSLYS